MLTMADNTITGNPYHGLLLRPGFSAISASITDNSFNNNSGYGIVVSDDSSNASNASSITIERNDFTGNTLGGIALGANLNSSSPAATITLDNNVIHNNSGSGVVIGLWDSSSGGLTKPGSSQCGGTPTALHHITVSNNTITQNTGRTSTNDDGVQGSAIFHCFNGKATITGNRIHDNGSSSAQSTIWFHLGSNSGQFTFQDNQVSGNEATTATLFMSYGTGPTSITSNAFHDNNAPNAFKPHLSQTTDPINLENNWWGANSEAFAESRIFHKNDDITFTNVDFIPILTTPPVSAPPAPPTNLAAQTANTSISLAWDANLEADIAGYKVHYDTDASGYPYANVVDVGNVTSHTLTGLTTGTTYYLAVTSYDTSEDESWHSGSAQTGVGEPQGAAKLSFITDPSGGVAGTPFPTQPMVAIQDVLGNTVNSSAAPVTLAITPGTGTAGAVLSGTITINAVNGVATFTNLNIDKAGSGYTITATTPGLTEAVNASFNLTAAAGPVAVPSVTQWGLLAMAVLLGLVIIGALGLHIRLQPRGGGPE